MAAIVPILAAVIANRRREDLEFHSRSSVRPVPVKISEIQTTVIALIVAVGCGFILFQIFCLLLWAMGVFS